MGYPVLHFEVIGKDGDSTKRFYSEMFDWKVDDDNPMSYGLVDRNDNRLEGGEGGISGGLGGAPEGYGGHLTFYVAVPDVEAAMQKAEQLGGKRLMGPDEVPNMGGLVIGQVEDPDGNVLGVLNGGPANG